MPVLRAAGLAVALLGLPITPPVFAGDFEDGMQFILNKDYPKAVESFKKAAAQGNPDAQFNLGVLYSRGRGINQDYEQAAVVSKGGRTGGHSRAIHDGLYLPQGPGS
jgi:TPR repeat protein